MWFEFQQQQQQKFNTLLTSRVYSSSVFVTWWVLSARVCVSIVCAFRFGWPMVKGQKWNLLPIIYFVSKMVSGQINRCAYSTHTHTPTHYSTDEQFFVNFFFSLFVKWWWWFLCDSFDFQWYIKFHIHLLLFFSFRFTRLRLHINASMHGVEIITSIEILFNETFNVLKLCTYIWKFDRYMPFFIWYEKNEQKKNV